MAIPKSLKKIDFAKAQKLIAKHLKARTGEWEAVPEASDFVYKQGSRWVLIRPGWSHDDWETGTVSL